MVCSLLICIAFTSCNVNLFSTYLGTTLPKTSQVDVFVDQAQITKPYTIHGKFYTQQTIYRQGFQKFIIKKAKSVGADAILFLEVTTLKNAANNNTNKFIDDNEAFTPQHNFNNDLNIKIIFLKYK